MKFDKEEIKRINKEDRDWFLHYWAEYVRTHPDKQWSSQQNILINSQIKNAKNFKIPRKRYLELKGEIWKK